jgi:hypothetical protein
MEDFKIHTLSRPALQEVGNLCWVELRGSGGGQTRAVTGGEREFWKNLQLRVHRLQKQRTAEGMALYEAWLKGVEWALINSKPVSEIGKTHLRKGRRPILEDGEPGTPRVFSLWCGRGNGYGNTLPDFNHWLVERIDCKACLKNLALTMAYQNATTLADHQAPPRLIGPTQKRGQGRPPKHKPKRSGSRIAFS